MLVGIAYVVYQRGFQKKRWWILALAGVILLASSSVRSPLLFVIFAFIASQLVGNRFRSFARIATTVFLVVLFAVSGAFMSNWRENASRQLGLETSELVTRTLDSPWVQIYESGIDTLDGYRFSQEIAPLEGPRPEDMLNIFLTFVPRALWDDKPVDLAVDVSTRYLNYGASGQYLSPVGYLTLALGSYPLALVGLFVFTVLAALLIRKFFQSFILSIVLCVVFRFFLGGSSFDIYYGLTLLVPYISAVCFVRIMAAATGRKPRNKSPIL